MSNLGDGGDCDSFFECGGFGFLFDLGIGNGNDRQPPIYTPPDTQNTTEPNPPAGDPDPSDPFSGPIWQEGGPQIPTENLAELLGVPDPPILVFDANGPDSNQLPVLQGSGKCVSDFYDTAVGNVVQFFSPLSLLPGWNPNWKGNAGGWLETLAGKGGGLFGSGFSKATQEITTLSGTVNVAGYFERKVTLGLDFLEEVSPWVIGGATLADLSAHQICSGDLIIP